MIDWLIDWKERGKLTQAILSLSCRTFSRQSIMSRQTKLGLWLRWGTSGGPPRPSPSPRWKVLPTPLICCFKIVIRWCFALQTIRRLAFLFSSNLKHASSWNLPQAIFIEKKMEPFFFSSYPMCFVIRARLNQPRNAWMTPRNWCKWFLSYYVINIQL